MFPRKIYPPVFGFPHHPVKVPKALRAPGSVTKLLRVFAQSSWAGRAREPTLPEERDSSVPSCPILSCPIPSHPHSRGCSTALPRHLAFKLFPQGPNENNKRILSFPDGIYFNLYITCHFGLIPFLFYSFLNSILFFALDIILVKKSC